MQEAIPFRTYLPTTTAGNRQMPGDRNRPDSGTTAHALMPMGENYVQNLVSENSVIVFGRRGCCMCHVVKRLLLGLGVNPQVLDVDEDEESTVASELLKISNGDKEGKMVGEVQFPVVFVGGKLFGGLDRVMATHISGELVPILKDAGALWL
ncbi:hypothetical protein K2173_000760 [Erythroxylum novogranatense]|uniref:Glutaredoxin domain-containing protein n=1 Tax=Erythroxylum novogranatense TaxID=1862640 RepID=A0AAV8T2U9_9ROSI|nr:hypothetical protein K2173_000760 [Erythroxylum novogranatense]